MQSVYKTLDYCGAFFFSIVAGSLHIFHIILKSSKEAGFQDLEEDDFHFIINKRNAALAVSYIKPQVGRKVAQGMFQDSVSAVLTAGENCVKKLKSLIWIQRRIKHSWKFLNKSGAGKIFDTFFCKIKNKFTKKEFASVVVKGFQCRLKDFFSIRDIVIKNFIQQRGCKKRSKAGFRLYTNKEILICGVQKYVKVSVR